MMTFAHLLHLKDVASPIKFNQFNARVLPVDTEGTPQITCKKHIDVIFYYLRKKSKLRSMDQYRHTTYNCLFKSYINNAYKRSIKDVINEFFVPVALPWHLVDEDSEFFDKIDRIDWVALNAYKDNKIGELLGPQRPFEMEFARDIMQQESDSLSVFDYGTYVAAFAEFLSDEMKVPSIPFRSDYLRSRYATLLWKYGIDKAKAGYVNENDDPTRLKGVFIPLTDDELINVE
ncbi:hypothetical protein KY284_016012 [Solanum tuberosum]|nr:hypothetical protein KY284_016012 [Solanum tuberosum]